MYKIRIGKDKLIYSEKGENLLRVLRDNNVSVPSICNGAGWCGKCKVRVLKGNSLTLTEEEKRLLSEEEIKNNIRLACHLTIEEDLEIEVLEEISTFNFSKEIEYKTSLNPLLNLERFRNKIDSKDIDISYIEYIEKRKYVVRNLEIVRRLPSFLKDGYLEGTIVVLDNEVIDLREKDLEKIYGFAIDIGTTTLVVSLLDITTGKRVGVKMEINPQVSYGADVLSRINYVMSDPHGLFVLWDLLISKLEDMIGSLCKEKDISVNDVYVGSIVGNSIMTHIFLGVDPSSIGVFPFTPVFKKSFLISSKDLFKSIKNAKIYTFPLISGYIGGDIVSGILALGMHRKPENSLLIDIGTNGEIVLKHDNKLFSCATAAGPAFEGGNISQGMIAVSGAIDHVWIEDGKVKYSVIGSTEEKGITGSGLVDAIAVMLDLEVLDKTGRMRKNEFNVGKVRITQKDIREFQLAKSAIRAGIEVLLNKADITYEDLDRIYVAGTFGNYINLENAIKVGLLPPIEIKKFVISGNTALMGAEILLLNKELIEEAEEIIKKVKYIDLSLSSEFQELFVKFIGWG
ncbi:MAG: ASKHA domain-containing protein [Dictyoglomus sp.]|uniref:ASKHA domain-containing protein n=1 Tax=Dictyoglomus sp. TaxID=28205 RepID=UPI003D0BB69D